MCRVSFIKQKHSLSLYCVDAIQTWRVSQQSKLNHFLSSSPTQTINSRIDKVKLDSLLSAFFHWSQKWESLKGLRFWHRGLVRERERGAALQTLLRLINWFVYLLIFCDKKNLDSAAMPKRLVIALPARKR